MGLSNYQLVLLDNLIYLDEITRVDEQYRSIGKVVNRLLYAGGDPSNGIGTGTIEADYYNHDTGKDIDMTPREEWIQILLAIKNDPVLCGMQIHSVADDMTTGFRAATFISDATEENIVIFRGTSTVPEWIDNGNGGYMEQTVNQKREQYQLDVLHAREKLYAVQAHIITSIARQCICSMTRSRSVAAR